MPTTRFDLRVASPRTGKPMLPARSQRRACACCGLLVATGWVLENGDSVCADCEDTIARAKLFFSEGYGRATLDTFAAHQARIDAQLSEPARVYLAGRLGLS